MTHRKQKQLQERPVQVNFSFDFAADAFDEGDLDELTPDERAHLTELRSQGLYVDPHEEILDQRKTDYMLVKQQECDLSLGRAVGILAHHGATVLRLDA